MITIDFISNHLDAIPALTKWFRNQWTEYYADLADEAMMQDFLEDVSRDSLPSRLVAFEGNELVGTIVLREGDTELFSEPPPELGGLYVTESHRGHGIATELVKAGMKLAHDQGYSEICATTVKAVGILERLGWEFIKKVQYRDGVLL